MGRKKKEQSESFDCNQHWRSCEESQSRAPKTRPTMAFNIMRQFHSFLRYSELRVQFSMLVLNAKHARSLALSKWRHYIFPDFSFTVWFFSLHHRMHFCLFSTAATQPIFNKTKQKTTRESAREREWERAQRTHNHAFDSLNAERETRKPVSAHLHCYTAS